MDASHRSTSVEDGYESLKAAHRISGGLTIADRMEILGTLRSSLLDRAEAYATAVSADFRYRSRHETLLTEISVVVSAIDLAIRKLPKWTRPERIGLTWPFWPAKAQVVRQPRGVAGIIGPSNYPVQLVLLPLVSAISAGCRAIVKPSERTPRTAELLEDHISKTIDPTIVRVFTGDAAVAARIARLPLDMILFTGSHSVGVEIAAAAATNLTPVVLELGGKSPVVVDRSADLNLAVTRIVSGKLLNGGQTCVAPDYVLVPAERMVEFVSLARDAAQKLHPGRETRDYSAILTDGAIARLRSLEADHVIEPLLPWPVSAPRYRPALVINPTLDSVIMREEIFGPLLPVLGYESLDEALRIVRNLPEPLAIYWFGDIGESFEKMAASTASGAISVNDTVVHAAVPQLPFGGVGQSGSGRYHGEAGFRAFSNERTVFVQSRLSLTSLLRPPFGKSADRILQGLLKQRRK
ncbi:aldehyde dehydrogenase family protein [Bradyrhizobium roseum]|uniref:aldehyde dehydrogenase family protein n=1 Tax=Bradyrhizobium roseum TaxID=3056648 RepID=UPI00261AC435|nr:aldehyde dehydrogenase family protein [Bradyrhizobium roseus]WKA30406.1 aldehyde dehydrogenase family protein [Bradyrhizobium roseus]